tara:strand:+ start:76 stop:609 length:534 start_codon:yes stop_codon:yes gene_type:complete
MKKSDLKNYIRENILSTLDEDIMDDTKALEDYEAKLDDVIKKKQEAGIEEDASDAVDYDTYVDIGKGYLSGFKRPHSLNDDELEVLGRKIVSSLYKGNIDRAVGELTEDEEPSDSEIKKNKSLAKAAEELAILQSEMKSLARKYSKAEGIEKEQVLNLLKSKTKLKKELESILDKKL